MKKLTRVFILIFLLSGCSGLPVSIPFLGTTVPTQPALPPNTATPFSLGPTHTPDLFVLNTLQPTTSPASGTPLVTDTPFPTSTPTVRPTITLEPIDPSLFTPSPNLFLTVQRSTNQL